MTGQPQRPYTFGRHQTHATRRLFYGDGPQSSNHKISTHPSQQSPKQVRSVIQYARFVVPFSAGPEGDPRSR